LTGSNKTKDLEYLKYFPFLSNAQSVIQELNITIEKIETTNVFDHVLYEIFKDLSLLLNPRLAAKIKFYPVPHYTFEVAKFYLTILVLKTLNNIALTRIWVKYFQNRIKAHIDYLLKENRSEISKINLFRTLFRLLESDNYFELKKITLDEGDQTFGLHIMKYLDVAARVENSDGERYQPAKLLNSTLHKGYVIIGYHETERLSIFIELFAKLKIFSLYSNDNDVMVESGKINLTVEKIKDLIKFSETISINIKKHHVANKELLYEEEKIRDVEKSNIIIKELLEENKLNIDHFPPCVNVLLDKLLSKKIPLSHNENILLCTYLAKKHFIQDHIIKIFSKAVNYDKKTTNYQVSSLVEKDLMPMNCSNLETEGICKKEQDTTAQCDHIKNPLSFK
jgi:DNA primase large subunit